MADPRMNSGLLARLEVPGRVSAEVTAEPGEVVAVIGPNGAGKSTLLRALAGLVPSRGEIEVGGESWSRPPRPVRDRSVGIAFQDQKLFPHLSARDNVAFGPRSRGVPRDHADRVAADWLDRFGVGELGRRRPGQLSGGQAQRVSIARALATDPRLLLLDEPFAGLDPGAKAHVEPLLSGGTRVLISHDVEEELAAADLVLGLKGGKVAFCERAVTADDVRTLYA
jgi:molybdate transport system ATP-binding protein